MLNLLNELKLARTRAGAAFTPMRSHRDYRLAIVGQFGASAGIGFTFYATQLVVLVHTHSALAVGLIGFAGNAPALVAAAPARLLALHFSQRKILMTAQTVSVVLPFCFIWTVNHGVSTSSLVVLSLVMGFVRSLDHTVRQVMMVDLLPPSEMQNAVAMDELISATTRTLIAGLAAFVFALCGPAWCYGLNVLGFVGAVVTLAMIKNPAQKHKHLNAYSERLPWVRAFFTNRVIVLTLLLVSVCSLTSAAQYSFELSVMVKVNLHAGAAMLGWMGIAGGLAAISASVLIAARPLSQSHRTLIVAVSGYALAMAVFVLGTSRYATVSLVASFVAGGSLSAFVIAANAALRAEAHRGLSIEIMALFSIAAFGLLAAGSYLSGWLISEFGISLTVCIGVVTLGLTSVFYFALRPRHSPAT